MLLLWPACVLLLASKTHVLRANIPPFHTHPAPTAEEAREDSSFQIWTLIIRGL